MRGAGAASPSAPASREGEPRSWLRSDFAPDASHGVDEASPVPLPASPSAPGRTPGASPSQPHALVAAEIGSALPRSLPPAIVWRKPHHEGESQAVLPQTMFVPSGAPQGARTLSVVGAKEIFGEQFAPSKTAFANVGAADATHIARQVSRAIARELRIDRERRGRTR